jgi:hypothetical protein
MSNASALPCVPNLIEEVQIHRFLSQFQHPNIVGCEIGVLEASSAKSVFSRFSTKSSSESLKLSLYLDVCDLGSLRKALARSQGECPEAFIWHAIHSVISGLVFMYTGFQSLSDFLSANAMSSPFNLVTVKDWNPISHNDLHTSNVLLKSSPDCTYPLIQICDFGGSKPLLSVLSPVTAEELEGRKEQLMVNQRKDVNMFFRSLRCALEREGLQYRYSTELLELLETADLDLLSVTRELTEDMRCAKYKLEVLPERMQRNILDASQDEDSDDE